MSPKLGGKVNERARALLEREARSMGRAAELVDACEVEGVLLIVYDLEPVEVLGVRERMLHERRYCVESRVDERRPVYTSGIITTEFRDE